LKALLDQGIENVGIACIWDPVAVAVAAEAGEGAEFDLRLGGKMGPMSGDPLDLRVKVTRVVPNAMQRFGPGQSKLGQAVALHTQGIDIVVNSHRTQTFCPEAFSNLGIDPQAKQALVVKSMQHFYAGFAPIAAKILYVAAPGAMYPNFNELPYRRASRDLWPLNAGR
jgi:microcystin degradation protein MlrC